MLLNQDKKTDLIQQAVLVRDLIKVEGLNQVEVCPFKFYFRLTGVASLLKRHKCWVSDVWH